MVPGIHNTHHPLGSPLFALRAFFLENVTWILQFDNPKNIFVKQWSKYRAGYVDCVSSLTRAMQFKV